MNPLDDLRKRLDNARQGMEDELARYCTAYTHNCEVRRVRDEVNTATDALIARLLSVIRCEECGGTGRKRLALPVHISGTGDRPIMQTRDDCPTCGPARAAIERMKGGTDEAK